MRRLMLVFYVVTLLALKCWSVEFTQEQAKVKYFNPKYISKVTAITRRVARNEPYRTNLTITVLVPFGNNVTFALILQLKNGGDFKIAAKVCDTINTKWMQTYMAQFTNLTRCPFQPGTYAYVNMELPPKNVPIPVMDGDYYIIYELSLTATKEKILVCSTLLHFDARSGGTRTKTADRNKNKKG